MTKAWTVSRGPILATEIDVEKAQAINLLLIRPIGILPQKPGDPIRPFAIGLFEDIRAISKPNVGVTTLRRAVAAFVHTKRYYFASAQPDALRHDIDGAPLQQLSDDDKLTAQARFLALREKTSGDERPERSITAPPPVNLQMSKAEQIRATLLGARGSRRPSPSGS